MRTSPFTLELLPHLAAPPGRPLPEHDLLHSAVLLAAVPGLAVSEPRLHLDLLNVPAGVEELPGAVWDVLHEGPGVGVPRPEPHAALPALIPRHPLALVHRSDKAAYFDH